MKVKYQRQLEKWAARRKEIVALHKKGLSQYQIADAVRPKISQGRVWQILKKEGMV